MQDICRSLDLDNLGFRCGDGDIPGPVEGEEVDGGGVLFLGVAVDARLPPQSQDGHRLRFRFLLSRSLDLSRRVVQGILYI